MFEYVIVGCGNEVNTRLLNEKSIDFVEGLTTEVTTSHEAIAGAIHEPSSLESLLLSSEEFLRLKLALVAKVRAINSGSESSFDNVHDESDEKQAKVAVFSC